MACIGVELKVKKEVEVTEWKGIDEGMSGKRVKEGKPCLNNFSFFQFLSISFNFFIV